MHAGIQAGTHWHSAWEALSTQDVGFEAEESVNRGNQQMGISEELNAAGEKGEAKPERPAPSPSRPEDAGFAVVLSLWKETDPRNFHTRRPVSTCLSPPSAGTMLASSKSRSFQPSFVERLYGKDHARGSRQGRHSCENL